MLSLIVDKPPRYRSFVLRFWEERPPRAQTSIWRFTIEDSETNTRYGFSSFEELAAFLERNTQR